MTRLLLTSLVLLAALSGGSLARADEVTFSRGDVDGDGLFTPADLRIMGKWMRGGPSVRVLEALDVNNDGNVSVADLFIVFARVHGHLIAPRVETVSFRRGDVDGNNVIDEGDVRALNGYLAGTAGVPGTLDAADLDMNGQIDELDYRLLRSRVSELSAPRE